MRAVDIIQKKRDGFELTKEEMSAMKGLDKKQRFFVSFEGTPYEKLVELTTGIVLPD